VQKLDFGINYKSNCCPKGN